MGHFASGGTFPNSALYWWEKNALSNIFLLLYHRSDDKHDDGDTHRSPA